MSSIVTRKVLNQKFGTETINSIISGITSERITFDEHTKILIKALTATNFEFFESFASQFKPVIDIMSESKNIDRFLNKYFFIIVEKYILRVNEVPQVSL